MKHNYLITIFDNGRYVKSYYSEGLAEIPSVRATNKGCHISVYDIKKMHTLTKDDIDKIIDEQKHVIDEKVEKPNANTPKEKADEGKKRRKRRRFENWRRPVTCVETGRTYWSIKSCKQEQVPALTLSGPVFFIHFSFFLITKRRIFAASEISKRLLLSIQPPTLEWRIHLPKGSILNNQMVFNQRKGTYGGTPA